MQRSSKEELKWVICNFPTESLANAANMSLNEYDKFISDACFLKKSNPIEQWESLSKDQSRIIAQLNRGETISVKSDIVDISFSINY